MKSKTLFLFTIPLLCGTPAVSAAPAAGNAAALQACTKISESAARLACFDKATGTKPDHSAAPAKATPAPEAAPQAKPAPGKAAPINAAPSAKAAPQAKESAPVMPSQQTTKAQFGSEQIEEPAQSDGTYPKALNKITGEVASYRFNPFKKFTITLKNGQIWRQQQGDTGRQAYFPHHGHVKVTITRGLFHSYNLTIDGSPRVYKVKRIK